ncbi:MAG: ribonuclease III [Demequinaceae bacterium]|nr:ribonuclease III [Demequinaceae bacterium]
MRHAAPGRVSALVKRLGVEIDPEMLVLALTHRSFAYEAGGIPTNERLEFLGDSVLGVVVTDRLYRDHPESPEGELAKMRASCVSQRALAEVAREIGLGDYVLLGKGEVTTGGAEKDSILCDALEAIIGGVYLSLGLDSARDLILRLVGPSLKRAAGSGAGLDWKTSLQEACAERGLGNPRYEVSGDGPDHARSFSATVVIDEEPRGTGSGTAKKHAEQDAARMAYEAIVGIESEQASVDDPSPALTDPSHPSDCSHG